MTPKKIRQKDSRYKPECYHCLANPACLYSLSKAVWDVCSACVVVRVVCVSRGVPLPLCGGVALTLDPDDVDPQQPVERLQCYTRHFGIFVLKVREREKEREKREREITLLTH